MCDYADSYDLGGHSHVVLNFGHINVHLMFPLFPFRMNYNIHESQLLENNETV